MGRNVVRYEQGPPTKRDDHYSWAVRLIFCAPAG
jgi:hypothetical protein